jgi:ribosomal-protein-alanine acetyltransferase
LLRKGVTSRRKERVVRLRTINELPLRDATLADIDDLISLETQSFAGDRLSRRSLRRLLRAPSAALRLAVEGGRIAGYSLLLFRAGSGIARLYSIAVRPDARGGGIGSRLLEDAVMTANRRGAAALSLEVRADNAGAIALYRRAGFEPNGTREDYYEDGATALRFLRRLGGGAGPGPGER